MLSEFTSLQIKIEIIIIQITADARNVLSCYAQIPDTSLIFNIRSAPPSTLMSADEYSCLSQSTPICAFRHLYATNGSACTR
jgi:hypothetical protein